MTGTPEEDLLAWLDREETLYGFSALDDALQDIETARSLFYKELGYDLNEEQFEALSRSLTLRYEEFFEVNVAYQRVEQAWGYQPIYRDTTTGRFISREAAFGRLE